MAKVCNAATALHINQYNSIASIVHTHNNWHTKHDLHLHHMSVTLSTTMSFILSASMSVINHYVRHRVAGVYKCHIMMRSHTMLKFFFSPLYVWKTFTLVPFQANTMLCFFRTTCHLSPGHLPPGTWNAKTMGKWGIPEKSFENVAQLRWPYLRRTLQSKVIAGNQFLGNRPL